MAKIPLFQPVFGDVDKSAQRSVLTESRWS